MNGIINYGEVGRGFYYDRQLKDELLTARLYPNSQLKTGVDSKTEEAYKSDGSYSAWVKFDDADTDDPKNQGVYSEIADNSSTGNTEEEIWKYSKTPLVTAILAEDFQVEIANSWSEFGQDMLGQMFNQMRSSAPYAGTLGKLLKNISEKSKARAEESASQGKKVVSKIEDVFGSIVGLIGKSQETSAKFGQRTLEVQGTRFSYYGGTGVNFPALGLRYTIFPKIITEDGTTSFVSVLKQIQNLLPYAVGAYIPLDLKELIGEEEVDTIEQKADDLFGSYEIYQTIKDAAGNSFDNIQNFVADFANWQLPPAGFKPDMKDIDRIQPGTFKLRLGNYYALENLVIQNMSVVCSKTTVKNPLSSIVSRGASFSPDEDYLTPASADISLILRPASRYSCNMINRFLGGAATKYSRQDYAETLAKDFTAVYDQYESLLSEIQLQ